MGNCQTSNAVQTSAGREAHPYHQKERAHEEPSSDFSAGRPMGRRKTGTTRGSFVTSRSRHAKRLSKSLHLVFGDISDDEDGLGQKSVMFQVGETTVDLMQSLETTALLLGTRQDESALTKKEVQAALKAYKELQRVLSVGTRTGSLMAKPSKFHHATDFTSRFQALKKEFDDANGDISKALTSPASVRPVTAESLQEVTDFFILDNSLRETTVGVARGHTMEEKHKILKSMAETGLEEVILGSFGSKISVDSQVAEEWRKLGKTMDTAWGFSDAYCMLPYDEDELWNSLEKYKDAERQGKDLPDFYTPPANPCLNFSKGDIELAKKASSGFIPNAFNGKKIAKVMKSCESEKGRVPLGLIMMAGYGICNAIIEFDLSVETFDYDRFDSVERAKFLIRWCKENLSKRQKVPEGEDPSPRVLINLRDFGNYLRSDGGLEEALRLVDSLSRLPDEERPFGFLMEEPTGFLWPDEVGKLCRMVRLTMDRAGFPQGRFLVHLHWYFGMAEACQLSALCNGADGVWAAVCKTGAQVGHACSTVTAVNLLRAGHTEIAEKYNLKKMCQAAREVTEVSTRKPCPGDMEIYGENAFDIPFMMTALPSCRYSLSSILKGVGVENRNIRLNELSSKGSIYNAMVYHFGPPEETGWDPKYTEKMWDAIVNHLMTGLSRDYNSPLGLGHLYGLVSRKQLPSRMVLKMMKHSHISDYHPTIGEFVQRWNRLCMKYEGFEVPPHPASTSKSIMMWNTSVELEPRLTELPFDFFLADVMRNPVMEHIPRLFKLQVIKLVTNDERKIQGKKIPVINFFESLLRLKLFVEEAEGLGVLGLVDDFCIRKNHDYFFGEDHLWLREVRGSRPRVLNKMIRQHIDFFPKYYATKGNNAMVRCVRAAAKRIDENEGIRSEIRRSFVTGENYEAIRKVRETSGAWHEYNEHHQKIFEELVGDEGEDPEIALDYNYTLRSLTGVTDESEWDFVKAYLEGQEIDADDISEYLNKRASAGLPPINGLDRILSDRSANKNALAILENGAFLLNPERKDDEDDDNADEQSMTESSS